MSITTRLRSYLMRHPKLQQWLWFAILWCAGLGSVLAVAYPIKWVIRSMG